MRSHALGLAWLYWQRHRLGMSLLAGYAAALAIVVRLLPTGRALDGAVLLTIPLMFGFPYLLSVFTHPDADIASGAPGYPSHLLVLPVRTRDLARWPALFGALTLAAAWLSLAGLIYRPINPNTPLFWPAAMLAAIVVVLQALFWTPFPLPYLRTAVALMLLPCLIVAGISAYLSGAPEARIVLGYLCVAVAAGWAAEVGLSRARCGEGGERSLQPARASGTVAAHPTVARKPFRSAFRAQVWLEWTRNGPMLPLFTAIVMLILTIPMVHSAQTGFDGFMMAAGPLTGLQPGFYLRNLLAALFVPVWLAATIGCGARKSDTRAKDLTIHSLLSTRPLTSMQIVVAKWTAAGLSCLAAWGAVLAFLLIWSLLPATLGGESGPLGVIVLRHATPKMAGFASAAVLFTMLWTWRNQVISLFADLTGRKWIVQGLPVTMGLGFSATVYAGAILYPDPANVQRAIELFPTIAAVLVVLKIVAAITALVALRNARLVSGQGLVTAVAVWLLLALLLYGVVRSLLPTGLITERATFLAVALWLPATRLALAPLSLHWNRHR